jgi:hypothetical protein
MYRHTSRCASKGIQLLHLKQRGLGTFYKSTWDYSVRREYSRGKRGLNNPLVSTGAVQNGRKTTLSSIIHEIFSLFIIVMEIFADKGEQSTSSRYSVHGPLSNHPG